MTRPGPLYPVLPWPRSPASGTFIAKDPRTVSTVRAAKILVLALAGLALLAGILVHTLAASEDEANTPRALSFTAEPHERSLNVEQGDEIHFQITCTSEDAPAWFGSQWMHLRYEPFGEHRGDKQDERTTEHTRSFTVLFAEPGYHHVQAFCNHQASDWTRIVTWTVNGY